MECQFRELILRVGRPERLDREGKPGMQPTAVRGSDPVDDGVLHQGVRESILGVVLDDQAGRYRLVDGVVRGVGIQVGRGLGDLGVEAPPAQCGHGEQHVDRRWKLRQPLPHDVPDAVRHFQRDHGGRVGQGARADQQPHDLFEVERVAVGAGQ
jgi:hypothetical protein